MVARASLALQRALQALGWLDAAEALGEAGAMGPLWRPREADAVRAGRAALEAAAAQVALRRARGVGRLRLGRGPGGWGVGR